MKTYRVWSARSIDDESEADGIEIDAFGPDDAAEDWAKRRDADMPDFRISDGFGVCVKVKDIASGAESTWSLSAELEPIYSAAKVEDAA